MLTVGTRDDGGKRVVGIGFGRRVEMEENELEEGEACSDQEDNPTIDPDIALSYIDEKIQHVLGQFQKDFEGGLCAENLGAKFGDYGSFLPTYQRSPSVQKSPSILSQPRSPNKDTNCGVARIPHATQLEATCPSRNTVTNSSDALTKCVPTSSQPLNSNPNKPLDHASTVQHESGNRSLNGKFSKSFKVRIKVCSENAQSRNNAALYSGLGLDMSPSSSSNEDSPDVNRDLTRTCHDSPSLSPHSTYKLYSCFQISTVVARLLSPVSESMLHLVDKKTQHQRQTKSEEKTPLRNDNSYIGKSRNPTARSGLPELPLLSEVSNINPKAGGNNMNGLSEGAVTDIPKKEITSRTHSGLKCAAEKPVRVTDGDKVSVSGISKRPEKSVGKRSGVSSEPVVPEPSGNSVEDKPVRAVIEQLSSKNEHVVDPFPDVKHSLDDSYGRRNSVTDKPYDKTASARETDEGYKGGQNESSKLKLPRNSDTKEQDKDRSFEGKLKSSGGKRKYKENGSNIALPLESVKGTSNAVSVLASKEKKKSMSSKGDRVKSNHKASRPPKEMDRSVSREGKNVTNSHVKVDEWGGDRVESIGDRIKRGHEDAHMQPAQAEHLKDMTTGKMVESMSFLADKSTQVTAAVGNITSLEPVQHIDEWVCCDKCQKWRLLPFGATTAKFPQNWICSMLDWLPGMNKCSVSEEDTTKACKALYEPHPADGHVASMGLYGVVQSATCADSQYHQQSGDFVCHGVAKKKPLMNASDMPGQPPTAVSAIHIKPRQQASLRKKNPNDVKLSNVDSVAMINSGTFQLSKAYDSSTGNHDFKQKEEDRSLDQYSDGGDSLEKSSKRSISKSTGEFIQAGFRTSKKTKLKESNHGDEDSRSIHSFECKAVDDTGYSRKMSPKNHREDSFSSASKLDIRGNSKKIATVRNAERVKENYMSDQDRPDITLKRKSLEWEENEALFGADVQEACETIRRKQKKFKLPKLDGRELSAGEVGVEADKGRKFPLSFKMDHLTNGVKKEGDFDKVDQHSQKCREARDDLGSLKRDSVRCQPSAATSSSSKVSGSHKSKTRFSETRGSPVDSVSSSPFRSYAIDKLSTKKKKRRTDNTVELDGSQRGNDGKVNGIHGEFGTKVKLKTRDTLPSRSIETNRSADSKLLDSAYHLQNNKICNDSPGKAANSLYAKLFGCTEDEPSPSACENFDTGADAAAISSERPDSNALHHFNGHFHEQNGDLAASDYQRKSGKISSSPAMMKYGNSMANYGGKMEMTTQRTSTRVVVDNQPASGLHVAPRVVCTDLEPTRVDTHNTGKELKNSSMKIGGKGQYEGKRDNPANSSAAVNKEANGSYSKASKSKDLSDKVCQSTTITRNGEECQKVEDCQTTSCKVDKRDSDRLLTERIDKSSRGRLEQLPNIKDKKRESHDRVLQGMQVTAKDDKSDGNFAEDVKDHSERLLKQGKKTENRSDKTVNMLDSGNGFRKSPSLSATNVIREARDLKHTANRKKNEGLEHESTPLYFQAALKFLHGALLLESSNNDGSKLSEMTSSIQMYSETAKLCEFCAHEYEKQKEMAAAALAYKCMEVAYMKVVYSKHPLAIKDRQELQAAPRIGESPSSSASDVDNVNNQSNMDKMTLDKIINPTQVASGHVIAARNRSNFVQMLSFVEIVNLAMDASRRSIHAFASASIRNESDEDVESLLSVRRVLDFSFHDIEGLLRLVRLSMECISR